jgi:hypothetical protein
MRVGEFAASRANISHSSPLQLLPNSDVLRDLDDAQTAVKEFFHVIV